MNTYHAVIGICLFILLWIQPLLGFAHHLAFKKQQSRTASSYGHLWIGRIAITLGMINGGLGFLLAGNSGPGPKFYVVFAVIIWLIYIVALVIGERKRSRAVAARQVTIPSNPRSQEMREY
jgi:hypothetical protein